MTVKLSLKPGEKFVLNGAVLINGDKATSFVIENQVTVLRDRDIVTAQEADTPAKRVYAAVMALYVGDGSREQGYDVFVTEMSAFMNGIDSGETLRICVAISRDVLSGQYYKALIKCRQLFDFEQPSGAVDNAA
jgi:flagellar protein FlbT